MVKVMKEHRVPSGDSGGGRGGSRGDRPAAATRNGCGAGYGVNEKATGDGYRVGWEGRG